MTKTFLRGHRGRGNYLWGIWALWNFAIIAILCSQTFYMKVEKLLISILLFPSHKIWSNSQTMLISIFIFQNLKDSCPNGHAFRGNCSYICPLSKIRIFRVTSLVSVSELHRSRVLSQSLSRISFSVPNFAINTQG